MKLVYAPHLNHNVVVGGRKRPTSYSRRLSAGSLLHASLPAAPDATHYETAAMAALVRMFLNNELGNCVIAGRAHRIGVLTANAGQPFVYTDDQVLAEYQRIGGYIPGKPATDQGCSMDVAADDGLSRGYADGSHDVGWIDVDAENAGEIMQMIHLFEVGDLGIELPDAWLANMPSGNDFVWDVAGDPNPENGHDIQIVDYDKDKGARISTWGLLGWLTWAALAKYGSQKAYGELIVHVNPDQLIKASQKAPNGFDWTTLLTYFNASGGHAPIPAPAPVSPPSGGGPVITLEQAQAWAKAGIAKSRMIMTPTMAERLAAAGLAANWPKA